MDGLEALHPKDSFCHRLVRQMRSPEARRRAHTFHLAVLQRTADLNHVIYTRRRTAEGVEQATNIAHAALVAAGPLPMPVPHLLRPLSWISQPLLDSQ